MVSEVKYTDFRLSQVSRPYEDEVVFLSTDSVLLRYAVEEGDKVLRLTSCCVGCGLQLKYSFSSGVDDRWGCIAANGCGRISSVGTEIHAHGIRSSVQVLNIDRYSQGDIFIGEWVSKWLDVSASSVEVELDFGPIKGSYIS